MKTRIIVSVGVFFAVAAFSALLGWVGGYNFDHRGSEVAFSLGAAATYSFLGFIITFTCPDWGDK